MRFLYQIYVLCFVVLSSSFVCAENPMLEAMEEVAKKSSKQKPAEKSKSDDIDKKVEPDKKPDKAEDEKSKPVKNDDNNPEDEDKQKVADKKADDTDKPKPQDSDDKKTDDAYKTKSDVSKQAADTNPADAAKSDPTAMASVATVQSSGPAEASVVDVQTSALDTLNIESSGNWLEKRIWYKKAEQLFDEIRDEVKKVADVRMEFVRQVHDAGQKIDEFYEQVNFEKGQIDELLKNVLDEVSQASFKRGGDLSDKERNIKLTIQTEQKQLEQLGKDIKKIGDFDSQIDKTMMQAFKIVDDCRKLESKAWETFKAIGVELDDKKARLAYYEIDNIYKNIEQDLKYLKVTLLPYLKTKLIALSQDAMKQISDAMKSLDEKGVNVEKLIKQQEKKDEDLIKQREEETEKDIEAKFEQKLEQEVDKRVKEKEAELEEKREEEAEEKRSELEKHWYYRIWFAMQDGVRCALCVTHQAVCDSWCWMSERWSDASIIEKVEEAKAKEEGYQDPSPTVLDLLKGVCCKVLEAFCFIFCAVKATICSVVCSITG